MEEFMKGDIVVIPFPFSDLSATKKRPALVIAKLTGNDLILVQITSVIHSDDYAVLLEQKNFIDGGLNQRSWIRPNKIFTADVSLISSKI